jgi:hypothetical protein
MRLNQFVVQEYEDKRVEEAQRQEKDSKGDSSSKAKMRREPFSFEDGMICNCALRAHTALILTAVSTFILGGLGELTGQPML